MRQIGALRSCVKERFAVPASCLGVGFISTWTELNYINSPVVYAANHDALFALFVTAQRSAQEVLDAARAEAKRIHNDAEIEASDIVDRANAEKAKIETAIEELDRSHKKTCEAYSEALKSFIDDANAKLDDIEDELAKKEGKKRSHGRFASPAQAPVHKPMFGATGAVAPSYVAPAAGAVESAPVTPAVTAAPATATVIPAQSAAPAPAPSVEKDLSGFGDAAEAFDLGDID